MGESLTETTSALVDLVSPLLSPTEIAAFVCLDTEAAVIGSAAAGRLASPVDVFVPTASGELGARIRGPVVIVVGGREWPRTLGPAIERIEYELGTIAALALVHEPRDPALVRHLAKTGRAIGVLVPEDMREPEGALRPGELDERGAHPILVRSADARLIEVPAQPWAPWPALAQLAHARELADAHLPAEPQLFAAAGKAIGGSRSPELPPAVVAALWRALFTTGDDGGEEIHKVAAEIELALPAALGLGIAVYCGGAQVCCQVCVNIRNIDGLARTIQKVSDELRRAAPMRPVVVASVFEALRLTSAAALTQKGLRLGDHTVVTSGPSGPALILAHVPCYMNWTTGQTLRALKRKSGLPATQVWVAPTRSWWIHESGTAEECAGGLPCRRQTLRTAAAASAEIDLVVGHLLAQLDSEHHIANAYYPRVDIAVHNGSQARKAIALAALLRAGRTEAVAPLAAIAAAGAADGFSERPSALLEQSHILLAMAARTQEPAFAGLLPRYLAHVSELLLETGSVRANLPPTAPEWSYLPGVLLTALATCQSGMGVPVLRPAKLAAALASARRRFATYPRWPEVWWQLRSWAAVHLVWPDPAVTGFLADLVAWTGRNQLASGAFLTWEWPTGPSLQSACVAEGLARAAPILGGDGPSAMTMRALEFCSSLVLDDRHARLWPQPSHAAGGFRSWAGGIELRTDAAGHYVCALLDHRDALMARELGR